MILRNNSGKNQAQLSLHCMLQVRDVRSALAPVLALVTGETGSKLFVKLRSEICLKQVSSFGVGNSVMET